MVRTSCPGVEEDAPRLVASHGRGRRPRPWGRSVRPPLVALPILVAAAALAAPVSAQVSFGVLAGPTRSAFSGPGSSGASSRTGFLVGGVGELALNDVFSIRPEVHLARKGARVLGWLGTRGYGDFALSYLQASVLGQLRAPVAQEVGPVLYGGFSVGFLARCSLAGRDCGELQGFDGHAAEVSIVWGAEIELFDAAVGVRYDAGVNSVNNLAQNAINNAVWLLTARYVLVRRD